MVSAVIFRLISSLAAPVTTGPGTCLPYKVAILDFASSQFSLFWGVGIYQALLIRLLEP